VKIERLRNKIEDTKKENKEMQEGYNQEINNLMQAVKDMEIDCKKKEFIINNFIPPEEKEKLTKCFIYNEKDNIFTLDISKAILNNYAVNREPLKKMKKNKIDAFTNLQYLKYDSYQQDEQIINLQIDLPEKLVESFSGQKNDIVSREIDHILKDDDSDLVYFDKELNIFDNNVSNSSFTSSTSGASNVGTTKETAKSNNNKDNNKSSSTGKRQESSKPKK